MNTKTIFILLQFLLVLILKSLYAENDWIVKGGFNYSKLRGIENEPNYNYSIGIERMIYRWKILSISPTILLFEQGGTIKNKPVWTRFFPISNTLFNYDINISGKGVEVGCAFDFKILEKKSFSLSGRIFPAYHIGGFDAELKEKEMIDTDDNNTYWENFDFEYRQGDFENTFEFKSSWSWNLGLVVYHNIYSFEVRYIHNIESVGQVGQLYPLEHKVSSLHFLFGISL